MQEFKTKKIILGALFAALTAALSQVAVPIGPVPINLATFAVFCAGALLGSKLGCLSLVIWIAVGIAGVPVFSMYRGGFGVLLGPTGGYVIGYALSAFAIGWIGERFNKNNNLKLYFAAMSIGSLVYFALGVAWYMFITNTRLPETLMVCFVPFIPGDLLKIVLAAILVRRLKPLKQFT